MTPMIFHRISAMTHPRRTPGRLAGVLLGLLALTTLPTGCDTDELLTETPEDILVADNLFTDLTGFEAGLNGLYAQARRERSGHTQSDASNDIMAIPMWVGTDNGWTNQFDPRTDLFQKFGVFLNPQESYINDVWVWLYQMVNMANTVIDRAENPSVKWTAADKARVVAEARFMRAWAYRHLSYLWGDVPLNLQESSGERIRTDWERAPRDSVRKVIIDDLLFAEANLPATSTNGGKVTKAVAQHYLAEMYLALGDAVKAEEKAAAVVNSGLYQLITSMYGSQTARAKAGVPFMAQFQDGSSNRSQGNTEALWVFQYAPLVAGGGESIMRRYWVNRYDRNSGMQVSIDNGGRGLGRISPTRWSISLYETADQRGGNPVGLPAGTLSGRFALRYYYLYNNPVGLPSGKKLGDTLFTRWNATETLSNNLWISTQKWDWADPLDISGARQYNDQVYLRLAETILLLAEAQFKQGKTGEAAVQINKLRTRAGASQITAAQVTLNLILEERSRELLCEEERRYTLLRTGTWYDRVKLYNPLAAANVAPRDTLLPIPQSVIDANIGKPMPQNPGY